MDEAPTDTDPGSTWQQHPVLSWLIVGAVSVLSLVLLALVLYPSIVLSNAIAVAAPTFLGACERIAESGIPPHPGDWWCSAPEWHVAANVTIFSVLVAIGFSFLVAILAAAGRRGTALLPLIPVQYLIVLTDESNWFTSTITHWVIRNAAILAILAAPAAAIMFIVPRRTTWPPRPRRRARIISAVLCLCATAVTVLVTQLSFSHHFGDSLSFDMSWSMVSFDIWGLQVASIAIFGALLGRDRRWWPWSIAVGALFLSQGPSQIGDMTFDWSPEGHYGWMMFGTVTPIFVIGLIWTAWGSLARRIASRLDHAPAIEAASPIAIRSTHRSSRLILNASAIAILIASALMFMADLLPARLNAPLPTYIREREQAQDVRARMNLDLAMKAMDAYRHKTHSYAGFHARTGEAAIPFLRWRDGVPQDDSSDDWLAIHILDATDDHARIAVGSEAGTAFCLDQRVGTGLRYGKSTTPPQSPSTQAIRSAIANCTSTPWTAEAIKPPPLPDCVARTSGFLICRMVSVLMFNILTPEADTSTPLPFAAGPPPPSGEFELSVLDDQYLKMRILGWRCNAGEEWTVQVQEESVGGSGSGGYSLGAVTGSGRMRGASGSYAPAGSAIFYGYDLVAHLDGHVASVNGNINFLSALPPPPPSTVTPDILRTVPIDLKARITPTSDHRCASRR